MPHYWEFVRGYIEMALEYANGELVANDIYDCLLKEAMFLFVAQKPLICGAATCEVVKYARKKSIRVVTLAGENFAKELNAELLKWAATIKADGIETYVRKGFVPQLEALGYRQIYVGMGLELDHGKEIWHTDG